MFETYMNVVQNSYFEYLIPILSLAMIVSIITPLLPDGWVFNKPLGAIGLICFIAIYWPLVLPFIAAAITLFIAMAICTSLFYISLQFVSSETYKKWKSKLWI